MREENTLHWS